MKTRRFAYWLDVLMLFSLMLSACAKQVVQAPASKQQPAAPETLVKVKAQILPLLSFAPYFIAQEEGYFADEGLEVEFVQFQRSSDAIPALLQGQVDVVGGALSFGLLNAMAKDAGMRLVADKGYLTDTGCSYASILAGKRLDPGSLDSKEALSGLRIVTNLASSRGYFMEEMLAEYGLTAADVEVVDIPDAAALEALGSGAADLAVLVEPAVTQALTGGYATEWRRVGERLPGFQIGLLTYGPNLLQKHPEVGDRFMVAYLKGVRQYNQGKTARNLEILEQYTQLGREVLELSCWPAFRDDGSIAAETVTAFQRWGAAQGLLDVVVDPALLINTRFTDHANQALGIK
jgi:NitT/TauT family transport system substrate-binding protein